MSAGEEAIKVELKLTFVNYSSGIMGPNCQSRGGLNYVRSTKKKKESLSDQFISKNLLKIQSNYITPVRMCQDAR